MFRGCVGNNGSKENSNTSSNNAITHYLRYTQEKKIIHTYTFTYTFTHGTIEKKRTYKTMRFNFSSHSLLLSYCFKGRIREREREGGRKKDALGRLSESENEMLAV